MKTIISCIFLMLIINFQAIAAQAYQPNSGDPELDDALLLIHKNINKKNKNKLSRFINQVASDFQVPPQKVEELFNHYEFNAPDVLMSVAIADISGEPLKNIAGVYFRNKKNGWKYALNKLNISKGSAFYKQIKKDIKAAN